MTTSKQDKEFLSAVISSNLLEESIDWICREFSPEDIFSKNQLESWADENGYIKEDK